jgi:metal-responsive CopG/Arc/MetJ family transcriptional regulator
MTSAKLAISLPRELFRELERARKRHRMTRSAVVQVGLRAWLRAQRHSERVRKYLDAYSARPETDLEVEEAARLIRATWRVEGDA